MTCPYCQKEMQDGIIHYDCRTPMTWTRDGKAPSFLDSIGGSGRLTAAETKWFGTGSIKATFCPSCKKLIIDTDIQS